MNLSMAMAGRAARRRLGAVALLATLGLLVGCAGIGAPQQWPAGTTRQQIEQRLGPPTAVHQLRQPLADPPDLQIDKSGKAVRRLEYGAGAFGPLARMFDFDEADRLLDSAQVRTEARFNAIRPGMGTQQLLRTIGQPSTIWRLGFQAQDVWAYRFESPFCQWFQVGVGDGGKVVDTTYGPDPLCDFNELSP